MTVDSAASAECQTDDRTDQMIDHPSTDRVVSKMFNVVFDQQSKPRDIQFVTI